MKKWCATIAPNPEHEADSTQRLASAEFTFYADNIDEASAMADSFVTNSRIRGYVDTLYEMAG